MNCLNLLTIIGLGLAIYLATFAEAGGDKSAKTTVITLAGGGDKSSGGYPIPIPIPVCTGGKHSHGHGHGGYGGYSGGGGGYGGGYGAQARMGWRRR